ncbi:MAG: hypothetical protein IPL52_05895 [Flavobacteriales bacterium]|nr:hypothetical protein [Flavobacteriales bacterium]
MQQRFSDISFSGITPWYYLPEGLVLPYAHNSISFDVNAIETVRNQMVNYRYFLEGYDKDWSSPTQETSVTFGNIREGTYTFKVKAQNPEGIWGNEVSYTFNVLPPWYRTWWMYVIYGVIALLLIRGYVMWRERKLKQEKVILEGKIEVATEVIRKDAEIIRKEKDRSEALLLNILPAEVAEELKAKGEAEAKLINEVTVLFTDFKGFTAMSEQLTPKELVKDLHECFSAFDAIMHKHNIEKIKTIGDAYMAAGGLPTPNNTHATDVINAAFEIRDFIAEGKAQKIAAGLPYFEIRIGVHTGPVVAGIVGVKKFSYDIWGDTVNTASRMESSGEVGQVNISEATYALVMDEHGLTFTPRGKVQAKGKGELEMYFVRRSSGGA